MKRSLSIKTKDNDQPVVPKITEETAPVLPNTINKPVVPSGRTSRLISSIDQFKSNANPPNPTSVPAAASVELPLPSPNSKPSDLGTGSSGGLFKHTSKSATIEEAKLRPLSSMKAKDDDQPVVTNKSEETSPILPNTASKPIVPSGRNSRFLSAIDQFKTITNTPNATSGHTAAPVEPTPPIPNSKPSDLDVSSSVVLLKQGSTSAAFEDTRHTISPSIPTKVFPVVQPVSKANASAEEHRPIAFKLKPIKIAPALPTTNPIAAVNPPPPITGSEMKAPDEIVDLRRRVQILEEIVERLQAEVARLQPSTAAGRTSHGYSQSTMLVNL